MYPTIAVVFPGQGSQYIGMLTGLYNKYSNIINEVFVEAADILGYDLWQLIQQGPVEKLAQTEFTQPAILTAGVAIWRICQQSKAFNPVILAGHSLGEYTALVCAEVLTFADAVALVAKRGQLMQSVVIPGGGTMAAILGLEDSEVIAACTTAAAMEKQIVEAVNFNAPGQVVIAGVTSAVQQAIAIAKAKGAKKAVVLPVSVPSHCGLMQPIAEQFSKQLMAVTWQLAKIPIIHNFDVQIHNNINEMQQALAKQLYNPVRWVETIEYIARLNVSLIAECGPGKVLTSLNKRIRKDLTSIALENDYQLLEQLLIEQAYG